MLEENDTEADYGHLMESITTTALELFPKRKKRREENPYRDPKIEHHRNILQESSLAHRTAPSFSTKEQLKDAKKQLNEAYTVATSQYIQKQTALLEKSARSIAAIAPGKS